MVENYGSRALTGMRRSGRGKSEKPESMPSLSKEG
jgi:hypothetical protein